MKIDSSAFPPPKSPPLCSKVHELFAQHMKYNCLP